LRSQPKKIKIAIIGLGKMGHYHLNALKALQKKDFESYYKADSTQILSRIEICGLCDISPDSLESFPPSMVFSDYQQLVKNTAPDVVIVATPTAEHFEIARCALKNNANAFIEKPIVTNSKEFNQLLEIAKKNSLKIMAGHVERYNPVSLKLREVLEDFKNSQKKFSFKRFQPHDPRIQDDIIIDKLIHDLDLSLFFFGPVKNYRVLSCKKKEDKVHQLILELEHQKSKGQIFVSWLKGKEICREINLETDNRTINGDFLEKTLKIDKEFINCRVPLWIEAQNNQIKDELVDFVTHCFSKSNSAPEPLLSVEEISYTVKIIEEISNKLKS
jgi:predicted dehydrogenase